MVIEANLLLSAYALLPLNKKDLALELVIENARFAFQIIVEGDGSVVPNLTASFMPQVSLAQSSFGNVNTDFLKELMNTLGQTESWFVDVVNWHLKSFL